MPSHARMLLVAAALLSSGVLQVAAAVGEDACCAEERGVAGPDCSPGVACACCPFRGAVQVAAPGVAPVSSPGVAVSIAACEPGPRPSATDIFHPPRA